MRLQKQWMIKNQTELATNNAHMRQLISQYGACKTRVNEVVVLGVDSNKEIEETLKHQMSTKIVCKITTKYA